MLAAGWRDLQGVDTGSRADRGHRLEAGELQDVADDLALSRRDEQADGSVGRVGLEAMEGDSIELTARERAPGGVGQMSLLDRETHHEWAGDVGSHTL